VRYKLYATDSWDKNQYPGATKLDSIFRTHVLLPCKMWWTPQAQPNNCKQPERKVCSWQAAMSGHHTTIHIEKGGCKYCGIGNNSIGITVEGKLIYHGYIQNGWLEDD